MKNLFYLLIVVLGTMLTQSCTTQQLGLANGSMQVYERYESQARIWKANNPYNRNSVGAHVIKYGNITVHIEWDNMMLRNERGSIILYKRDKKGNWISEGVVNPYAGNSFSRDGFTKYGSEKVTIVAVGGRIDVKTRSESYQMR